MPRIRTAHKFSERQRTGDVLADELVDFKSLLLSPDVLRGLSSSGFERPSPIQLKAIPLGRCGLDLIAQAKSGTGKTCVFSVIALESVLLDRNANQVLILAPTREIAVQIRDVITAIGSEMKNLVCHVFIGGLPVDEDKKMLRKACHIAVGTPGRVKYLIENRFLKTESVRLFILDEADKLLEDNFQEQINWIFSSLPPNKQMMAFSATYPEYLAKHLTRYMREPTFVRLNATDPTLQGIKQFHRMVPFHPLPHKTFQGKVSELLTLLSSLPFQQCLVFSNYQIRAQSLCDTLRLKGWPSVFIAGSQTQAQRLKAMERLKQFKCRVLISTDLTSRGIDAENVNVVVNMDVPRDHETYLHRIGRAGRFGTHGVAVTFVAQGDEEKLFRRIEENIGSTIEALPDPILQSLGAGISGNSTELDPATAQPQTTSVVVDILRSDNLKQSDAVMKQDSSFVDQSKHYIESTEEVLDHVGEIACIEDQSSSAADSLVEKESLAATAEKQTDQQSVEKFQTEAAVGPSNVSETEEIISNVQERLQTSSLHLDQNCVRENINEKQFQNVQINCKESKLQTNKADPAGAVNCHTTCEVSSCNDLKECESKTDHKQSIPFDSSEENYSRAKDSLRELLVDADFSLHLEPNCFSETTNELNIASKESASLTTTQGNKNETVIGNFMVASSESDEENSSRTQSSDENLSGSSSDGEESFNVLEVDTCVEASKQSYTHSLPPVDEFERDFENYLEHVSVNSVGDNAFKNFDLQPSKLLDDDRDEYGVNSCEDDDYDGTTAKAYAVSENLNTVTEPCHQIFQEDLTSGCYSHYNEQFNGAQRDNFDFGENSVSERHWDNHYPSIDFHDERHGFYNNYFSHYYNCSHYNYDQGYLLPHTGLNWLTWATDTQPQTDSASLQQYLGQFCDDNGSYQEYQWNASWYNAYQRQTSCIRQFASFSRSFKL